MYANGIMTPVETIKGMGAKGDKETGGGCEFKYDIFVRTFMDATM
jgi:hypothetical protein